MNRIPVLERFWTRVLEHAGEADLRLEPASGVVIKFHRQGATVKRTTPLVIPNDDQPVVVDLYSMGALDAGEDVELQVGGREDERLTVDAIDAANLTVTVRNPVSNPPITLEDGERLVTLANPPSVYVDPLGTEAAGTSLTTDADGYAAAYVRAYRYDVTVPALTGIEAAVQPDREGSWVF